MPVNTPNIVRSEFTSQPDEPLPSERKPQTSPIVLVLGLVAAVALVLALVGFMGWSSKASLLDGYQKSTALDIKARDASLAEVKNAWEGAKRERDAEKHKVASAETAQRAAEERLAEAGKNLLAAEAKLEAKEKDLQKTDAARQATERVRADLEARIKAGLTAPLDAATQMALKTAQDDHAARAKAETEVAKLKDDLSRIRDQSAKLEETQKQLKTAQDASNKAQSQVADLQAQVQRLTAQVATDEQEITNLKNAQRPPHK